MKTRVGTGLNGTLLLLVGFVSLLAGTGLQAPLLDLCGYFLLSLLFLALLMALLGIRGVRVSAVHALPETGSPQVWAQVLCPRREGPLGVQLRVGPSAGRETPIWTPLPGGLRLDWPGGTVHAPTDPIRVRIRAYPLGLVWISREVDSEPVTFEREDEAERTTRRAEPGGLPIEPTGAVREYRPGDRPGDIHWAHSARRAEPVVRVKRGDDELPAGRRPPRAEADLMPPEEHHPLMHVATVIAGTGAIGYVWSLSIVKPMVAAAAMLLVLLGGWRSWRRQRNPGWPLLVVLYAGIALSLAWYVRELRDWQAAPRLTATLLISVITIFGWDLRNRVYMRAQQLNALLLMIYASAIIQIRETPIVGFLFLVTGTAQVLASWADGRHEVGQHRVVWKDLKDLPSAWVPLTLLGVGAMLVQPYLPGLPLPPLPTFGITSGVAFSNRLRSEGLPGQGGEIALDHRWSVSDSPVLTLEGAAPERLRTEVFDGYARGRWFKTDRRLSTRQRLDSPGSHVQIKFQVAGLETLPVPEQHDWVYVPDHRLRWFEDDTVSTLRPNPRGFIYLTHRGSSPRTPVAPPPVPARSSAVLRGYARQWSQNAKTPGDALTAITRQLRKSRRYDLDAATAPPGVDPTEHFVRTGPAGFCVHFASALALMGRELGIPTRLVTGFLARDPDAQGVITVRERDAHAWVEAWVEGGWVRFDPTPPRTEAEDVALPWREVSLVLLGFFSLVWGFRNADREKPAIREYRRMLKTLQRRGLAIAGHHTPDQILDLARNRLDATEWQTFEHLTGVYGRERFDR